MFLSPGTREAGPLRAVTSNFGLIVVVWIVLYFILSRPHILLVRHEQENLEELAVVSDKTSKTTRPERRHLEPWTSAPSYKDCGDTEVEREIMME